MSNNQDLKCRRSNGSLFNQRFHRINYQRIGAHPDSVTSIGEYAFLCCEKLTAAYNGTKAQWNAISKPDSFAGSDLTIICLDGDI